MKNFQSFWLVQCDIGRGMVDIFGCICACAMVILISRVIEEKLSFIGKPLAYFGKYSLLCSYCRTGSLPMVAHSMETCSTQHPSGVFIIAGKLIIDLGCAFIMSKIPFVRKMFGFRN